MRKTYRWNAIIFAFLGALLMYAKTKSIILTIIVGAAVGVAAWFLIIKIETLMYKGADKAKEAIYNAAEKRQEANKAEEEKNKNE